MNYNQLYPLAFFCLSENIFVSWFGFCFLEGLMFKALLLFKYSWISGMNDLFVERFLLLTNLSSQIIIQTFRYWLGSMHESREFQLLSGIKVSYTEVYWTIFPIVFLIIVAISYIIIIVKKVLEKVRDCKVQRTVSISTLESAQSIHSGTSTPTSQYWNTTKYNPAIFSGVHTFIFIGLAVIFCIIQLVIMEHFRSSEFIPYETWLFEKLVIEIFAFRLLAPLGVIWARRDFLLFIK